ncbi:sensor domain-containing diguanylate cyclase [Vibrio fluvialis]|uniref:diguanylate cyclase n=1 Tax=Vibrio fluvialis PG41 TaxID=1336752 RepID=S7I607_VIBFL|nr:MULTISPECIES: sensor domain-containing diguanylate cyclase [Vibrio]EPP23297.1 GGDEF family protein [Vibrio fluvialis PG41]MBY7897763.1 sensor domain-containing diguanylate cyclase [Vibrio fluvialis]MBY8245118.1 sensor domain-containing diguanylate cyclase [Vibrio fluvialis]
MFEKLNLRKLILILGVFSVVITLFNAFYSIYKVQRDLIVNNTMESNRVYAEKMAEMTDAFIESAFSQLKFSAHVLSSKMNNSQVLELEAERLRTQTDSFNSVVIVNTEGIIVAVSPETVQVKGVKLTSERSLQSLRAQAPIITDPFVSPAGNYLTSISYPIFSSSGEYLGYVGGTIYLEKKNILTTLLGQHGYKDGSYLYVVDRNHTLIYHPDKRRIGQVIVNNEVINDVIQGDFGGKDIFNSQGVEMLAGYAPVKNAGWGIVAQKSKQLTLSTLDEQMWKVFLESLPIGILTLLLIWVSSIFISRPLWQLASAVRNFESHVKTMDDLKKIKPWYFEASHLKISFLRAFSIVSNTIEKLHSDSLTDSMTGLLNRRGLDKAIESFRLENIPFSVLALDIDYFKKVNDTYGHDVGDELLKNVSQLMKNQAREHDVLCRAGGEEFMIFLPNTDLNRAFEAAERIRKSIEIYSFPTVGNITISIGISSWKGLAERIDDVIKKSDQALYKAKNNGRNRTEVN